jgi:hypothetical protein
MVLVDDLNSLTTLLFNTVSGLGSIFYFEEIFKGLYLITNKHKYTAMKSYFSFLFILLALTSCKDEIKTG